MCLLSSILTNNAIIKKTLLINVLICSGKKVHILFINKYKSYLFFNRVKSNFFWRRVK